MRFESVRSRQRLGRQQGGVCRAATNPSPSAASGDGIFRVLKKLPRLKVTAARSGQVAARLDPPASIAGNQRPRLNSSTTFRIARVCSGVLPQQEPMMFAPAAIAAGTYAGDPESGRGI